MSQNDIHAKKELERIKMAERNQLPHRKEYRRKASLATSKERKVGSTAKRFDEHTMDELIKIARQKCEARNIDYNKYQDVLLTALRILRDDGSVFSDAGTYIIYVPTSNPDNPSQKNGDTADHSPESKIR